MDLLIAIVSILSFFVAGISLVKYRRSLSHVSLAFLSLVMGIWALAFIPYTTPFIFDSEFWIKFIYASVNLLVGGIFFFSFAFPTNKVPPRWTIIPFPILSIVIWYLIFFTDKVVMGVQMTPSGLETTLGSWYPEVSLFWMAYSIAGVSNQIKNFLKSSGTERLQFLYIFTGLGLYVAGAVIFDVFFPLISGTSKYFSLSAVASFFFIGLTGYAIIRHRLLDIRFALKGTLNYLINSLVVAIMFWFIAIAYWSATNVPIKSGVLILIGVASLFFNFIYNHLTKVFNNFVNQHLFPSTYDYQLTIRDLSKKLANVLSTTELVTLVSKTILNSLRVERVAIILRKDGGHFVISKLQGFNEKEISTLSGSKVLLHRLESQGHALVSEEIRRRITESDPERDSLSYLSDLFKKSEIELVVPVVNSGKLVAVFILGRRLNQDAFTVQDINLLNTISGQFGTALENTYLYRGISDANQNLQKKIDEATSELKQKNQSIIKALDELKGLDEMKNQLIAVTSHELKSPATIVQNYLWVVLNQPSDNTKLSEEDRKKLERSLGGIQSLIRLINDILNVSRIEGGKLAVNIESVNATEVIRQVLSDFSTKFEEKRLTFRFEQKEDVYILADREKFQEVVTNLVSNALKYTDQGSLEVKIESSQSQTTFSFTDTGRGIQAGHIQNLFKKFYREDAALSASNPNTGGTGLGLYISKSFIEQMQGKIWVESKIGQGSTFFFNLPTPKDAPEGSDTLKNKSGGYTLN